MTTLTAPHPPETSEASGDSGVRAPNATAQLLTGRDYVSWSQINSYRGCPQRFAFLYLEGMEPAFIGSGLAFGSAIHSTLEHYYQHKLEGLTPEGDELLEWFRQAWADEVDDTPVRWNKGETADTLNDLAQRMITAFLASPLANPDEVIAVEETLRQELDPNLPDVLARVDLVIRQDDQLRVIDFKTSKSKWSADTARQNADQLLLYRELAARMDEQHDPQLQFAVITKHKTPQIDVMPLDADDDRRDATLQTMKTVWQAIEAGLIYPNPSAMNCTGCAFKSHCPVWQ